MKGVDFYFCKNIKGIEFTRVNNIIFLTIKPHSFIYNPLPLVFRPDHDLDLYLLNISKDGNITIKESIEFPISIRYIGQKIDDPDDKYIYN